MENGSKKADSQLNILKIICSLLTLLQAYFYTYLLHPFTVTIETYPCHTNQTWFCISPSDIQYYVHIMDGPVIIRPAIYTQTVFPIMMQHQVIIIQYIKEEQLLVSISLAEQIYKAKVWGQCLKSKVPN